MSILVYWYIGLLVCKVVIDAINSERIKRKTLADRSLQKSEGWNKRTNESMITFGLPSII